MTLLKWNEPFDYTRACYKAAAKLSIRQRALLSLIVAFCLLGAWGIAKLNPQKTPPPFWIVLPASLAFGVFITYFAPWLYSFAPAQVRITEKTIIRSAGQTARTIKPHMILSFCFEEQHGYTVLRLVISKQPDLVCALPKDKDPIQVARVLAELKIQKKI